MNKKHVLLFLLCAFIINNTFAQVSVNPLTGAGSVNIPIYNIQSGQISVPVTLAYSAGVKPKDVEGNGGMGWNVIAGGQVSRLLRGLPDDCTFDATSKTANGWMNSSSPTAITNFIVANNGTCATENSDLTYINNYLSATNQDTEPDIFYVSAPGLNCQLVYDRTTSRFRPIAYQDLVISYTTAGGTSLSASLITSFTITNDKAVKYVFSFVRAVDQRTLPGTNTNYFTTRYAQYRNTISYFDNWYLTSITDPAGNAVTFNYHSSSSRSGTDSVSLFLSGSNTQSLQYRVSQTTHPLILSSINKQNAKGATTCLTFSCDTLFGQGTTGQTVLTDISGMGHEFQLKYSPFVYDPTGYMRYFLVNFTEVGAGLNTPVNYSFGYIGNTDIPSGGAHTTLPDSATTKVDYWGYYSAHPGSSGTLNPSVYVNPSNGALQRYAIDALASPGSSYPYTLIHSDRSADPAVVATGSLNKITNAQGGITTIIYESNDYLDVPSNTVVQGGGIRVKKIIDSVSKTSTNNMVRNYSYTIPSSSFISSGKPISLPVFAFTIPYSGGITSQSLAATSTALSANDLSDEDHTIMYVYSSVYQTGKGKTQYQFYIPAANWDASALPACSSCTTSDWSPTIDYSARLNCVTQAVKNDIYSYPFAPNPNYDFERGLLQKVTNYNDDPTPREVSETSYTYKRSFTPSFISAFKIDDNNTVSYSTKAYSKYAIYYNTSELTFSVTTKVFDSPTLSMARTNTVNYNYDSANHKLLTQQQITNSDNSILATHYSYVKDYTSAAAGSNANVNALYYLQQQNINAPVETYQQVTRNGTTVTTGASLNLFKAVTPGSTTFYLPSQQFKMVRPDGVSFTPYNVNGSTQTSTYDPKYFGAANFDTYDINGYLLTADDSSKNIQTTIIDHNSNQPVAVFTNAACSEVAYSDFDSQIISPAGTFTITGSGSYMPIGSHAGNAAGLASTQTVTSSTLTKNAAAKKYIFSIWVNAVAGGGTLSLSLPGTSVSPVTLSAGWKYYEVSIPVDTLPSSFTFSFNSSQNISIDDILFYPDVASAATATYDPVSYAKIASTNTNGVSSYYKSDRWGRLLYQYDQDKNIVLKKTYLTPNNVKDFTAPVINYSPRVLTSTDPPLTTTTAIAFSASYIDPFVSDGLTYTWDFGDGTGIVTTTSIAPAHTYATANTYTVKLTVSSPYFGSKSAAPITITILQAVATLSYNNYAATAGITSVNFSGPHSYSYTANQIQQGTATVIPGTYTVTIVPFGSKYDPTFGKGYTNIVFADGANGYCLGYTGSNFTFTWTVIANHTLNFSVYNNGTCPFF
ncbi:MAG: hypothetical protein JWP78_3710 [Mucilaginibacter sp.]|nr:hypothetical protein [Mucilaginibacter sp.]